MAARWSYLHEVWHTLAHALSTDECIIGYIYIYIYIYGAPGQYNEGEKWKPEPKLVCSFPLSVSL